MIYAVIAAGGIGSRMGNLEKPKQYLTLKNKPIIAHTVEKFYVNSKFEKVIILCPEQWVSHTKSILKKHLPENDRVVVLQGGNTRNETIMNAIKFIEETDGLDDETIIVTHDAVRPFVTARIIEENIDAALRYGATDTVVPATDTIVESQNKKTISNIPDRSKLYQGQTPQAFKAKLLKDLYYSLTEEEKDILTDACKIFSMKGYDVHLIDGEVHNIKITYPYDLRVAMALLEDENKQ
ncbi:MAG: 2-C-methyl-D-erythritol 4-phosphate cytidylyltransferase [Acutalibacteraceae bacterium]|nr:2-C-methyl-D-erythritol 4-phosphate cytidylyltransferase [Acutalibacteraceae bacterium]